MVEVVPKFPHESYNVFSLVVTGLFFYWAYNAIIRFYRAMLLRSAVASEDAVLIRGVGSNLYYFEGAWPMHAHAILHTRQAEPPKPIKSLVIPFQLKNIRWMEPRLLRFDLSAMADCAVTVLLDIDVHSIRQCFGTERSTNRSFLRTQASLQSHCLKSKKNLDTYSSELAQIFASGGFCSIGGKVEFIPSGGHSDINLPVTSRAIYSPMDVTGGVHLEASALEEEFPPHTPPSPLSPRNSSLEAVKHTALLVVPNQSLKRGREERSSVLPSRSSDSRERPKSLSYDRDDDRGSDRAFLLAANDSSVSLDFALLILTSAPSSHPQHQQPQQDASGELRVDELLIHADGGLHSVHDVYGVPSSYSAPPLPQRAGRDGEEGKEDRQDQQRQQDQAAKSEEDDCVICLTEKKDIFLLPCRHMCVCKGCFIHIDKCPVCRSPFNTYVLVQDTATSPSSASTSANGTGTTGTGSEEYAGGGGGFLGPEGV